MRASVAASRKLKLRTDDTANKSSNVVTNNQNKSKSNGKVKLQQSIKPSCTFNITNHSESKAKFHRTQTSSAPQVHKNQKNPRTQKSTQAQYLKSNATIQIPSHGLQKSHLDTLILKESDTSDKLTASIQSPHQKNEKTLSNNKDDSLYKLKLAMSSADAFKRGVTKGEEKFVNVKRKKYYQKAITLMVSGGLIFSAGIVFAILHFADYFTKVQILGPICLAIGLLMIICGLVWLPIIKTKLKRRENVMNRTFSL